MKKKIVQYLKDKDIYNVGFDFLITILCNQITLYNKANRAINSEGISVAGNAEGTFMVRNQHLKTLSECIANINSISKKLGLTPRDLAELKIANADDNDGFDEFN